MAHPVSVFFLLPVNSHAQEKIDLVEDEVFKLSLADLGLLEVYSSATLTKTQLKKIPSAVTRITKEMIENSGALSLDELLEMFVPSLEIRRHQTVNSAIGMRGNIGGTANRTLLLVNGRVLNDKTALGAMNSRYNSMLGDIDYIEVARGPGSATYGPGAIIGVINIHTLNGESFEGTDVTVRQGFIENFTNVEFRHSQDLSEYGLEGNAFVYYGVDKYLGSSGADSPARFGSTFGPINAGEDVNSSVNDHASYRNRLRHKFHAEYNNGGTNFWVRYVNGGEDFFGDRREILSNGTGRQTQTMDKAINN
jgi:outer membrane cobalamin receptor